MTQPPSADCQAQLQTWDIHIQGQQKLYEQQRAWLVDSVRRFAQPLLQDPLVAGLTIALSDGLVRLTLQPVDPQHPPALFDNGLVSHEHPLSERWGMTARAWEQWTQQIDQHWQAWSLLWEGVVFSEKLNSTLLKDYPKRHGWVDLGSFSKPAPTPTAPKP